MEILELYKQQLLAEIQNLGYESLRYSIFSDKNPDEWEVVIEFDKLEQLYYIYGTMDRSSYNGKHSFKTFEEAKIAFLEFLSDVILINKYYVEQNMPTNYYSPLWSKNLPKYWF